MSRLIHLGPRRVSGKRPAPVLRALGVPFKKGGSFWHTNEGELHYIFADFEKAARERKRDLHPDAGGDHESMVALNAACEVVYKAFAKRGIGPLPSAAQREQAKEERELQKSLQPRIGQTPRDKHKEHLALRARQGRVRRWKDIDTFRAKRRAYYARKKAEGKVEDPEKRRQITARYKKRHPKKVLLTQRKYRRKNPEKVRQWKKNYVASAKRRGVKIKSGGEGNRVIPGTEAHARRLAQRRKARAAKKKSASMNTCLPYQQK